MTKTPVFNTSRDIHPFDTGKSGPIKLAGIEIESQYGFKAHSDGDVVIHAIVDALLGIIACPQKRDIGSIFPDTDPALKDADSKIFLEAACALAANFDVDITHINIQIACKSPKLSAHYEAMAQNLSAIMKLPVNAINVQAMSNNGCGEEGRGEAVSALASVSALKPA